VGHAGLSGNRGNIWTMDPDGSNQVQVTATGGDEECPVWSPDGTLMALLEDPSNTGAASVYVMNADGSNLHQVEVLTTNAVCSNGPSWQPLP